MTRLAAALLLLAGHAAAARTSSVEVEGASFAAPAGWPRERRGDGLVLSGPRAQGVSARIVVRRVREPDPAEPRAYMDRLSRPSSVPLDEWKAGKVEPRRVGGRAALRLEREASRFADAGSAEPKEVAVREEHVAVPAEGGYYLLVYSAPRSLDAKTRPAFLRLLSSVKFRR